MNTQNKLSVAILTALGLSLGVASFSSHAEPKSGIEQGDVFMRLTATQVAPNTSSTDFTLAPGVAPDAEDSTSLGITFVYMINNNVGLEVLAAWPFEHDITVNGAKVGSTKQLPPTVSLQYYFNPASKLRPYIGGGINYTTFFSSSTVEGLGGDLSLDDSFGLAAQIGVDYDINEKWFLNADIRYINIETTAEIAAVGTSNVDINPTVFSVGVGYKF